MNSVLEISPPDGWSILRIRNGLELCLYVRIKEINNRSMQNKGRKRISKRQEGSKARMESSFSKTFMGSLPSHCTGDPTADVVCRKLNSKSFCKIFPYGYVCNKKE